MANNDSLILIYTALRKPSYRRGMFDALSYPPGHVVRYSYRKHHIHPSLLKCACDLEGKKGLIVYVDVDENNQVTYLPVRFVHIHRLTEPAAPFTDLPERERIRIPIRLEQFVQYTGQNKREWHDTVSQFDGLREIEGKDPGQPRYFVVKGAAKFKAASLSAQSVWEDLIGILSESAKLRDGVFLRLDHLKEDSPSHFEVDRALIGDRLIYKLRPGKFYRLDFSVYEPTTKPETKIEVKTSATELLTVDQPHQSVVSGLVEKSALIASKRTIEHFSATISVAVSEDAKRISAVVNSPSPVLFVRVSPPPVLLLTFLGLVFAGSLLLAGDPDRVKLLGASFLALAALLAFRRLPSGAF